MKFIFHDSAQHELRLAARWLDEKAGLGDEFLQIVEDHLASIDSNPLQFGPAPGTHRQDGIRIASIRRFHYAVYYRILKCDDGIFVIAIQHARRHPRNWIERLDDIDLRD